MKGTCMKSIQDGKLPEFMVLFSEISIFPSILKLQYSLVVY